MKSKIFKENRISKHYKTVATLLFSRGLRRKTSENGKKLLHGKHFSAAIFWAKSRVRKGGRAPSSGAVCAVVGSGLCAHCVCRNGALRRVFTGCAKRSSCFVCVGCAACLLVGCIVGLAGRVDFFVLQTS